MTLATPAPKLKYKEFMTRNKSSLTRIMNYRNSLKGVYVVARIFCLLTALPGPALVLLSNSHQPFSSPLYTHIRCQVVVKKDRVRHFPNLGLSPCFLRTKLNVHAWLNFLQPRPILWCARQGFLNSESCDESV